MNIDLAIIWNVFIFVWLPRHTPFTQFLQPKNHQQAVPLRWTHLAFAVEAENLMTYTRRAAGLYFM